MSKQEQGNCSGIVGDGVLIALTELVFSGMKVICGKQ